MARRQSRRRKVRKRGRFGLLYKLMSFLIICVAIIAGSMVFFRVDTIIVTGNERYTQEEIIAVTGIEQGDNLFSLNKFSIVQDLLAQLPYMAEVNITRKLPDTIIITGRESEPMATIQASGDWWLVNSQGKLLERGDATIASGEPEITGLSPLAPAVGTIIAVEEASRDKLTQLVSLFSALQAQGLDGGVTEFVDLSADNEIRFGYGADLTVILPMNGDFSDYIFALQRVIQSYQEQQVALTGTLDLTYGESEAHVLPDRWTPTEEVADVEEPVDETLAPEDVTQGESLDETT